VGKVFAVGCALALFLAGCGGGDASSDPTVRPAPSDGTDKSSATPADAESESQITPTKANAPCRQIVFLGRTYAPAPEQPRIGVGGILTADGRYAATGTTAKARGLNCGDKSVLQVEVYSSPDVPVSHALTVSGSSFGNTGVWEYVNVRLVD